MEGKSSLTKLEKLPRMVLQYEWKLPNFCKDKVFLSRKMRYQADQVPDFQAALKLSSSSTQSSAELVFTATNLNKMGLKTSNVSFSTPNSGITYMDLIQPTSFSGEEADGNDIAIQLFTSKLGHVSFSRAQTTTSLTIYFTVHLTGIVENYQVCQTDSLLSQQLLSSAMDKAGTDINLYARDGEHFTAHKFVLATRSPVFAALHSEDGIKSDHTIDCTHEEMIQFVKFIYTGEMFRTFSSGLLKLAVDYQVGTLEKLCQAASQEISMKEMCSLAMHLQPGSNTSRLPLNVEVTPYVDVKEVDYSRTNVSSHKFTWKVEGWTKEEPKTNTATSLAPKHGEENPFFVELKAQNYDSSNHLFLIKLIVNYGHQNINGYIEEVICCVDRDVNGAVQQQIKLIERPTQDKKLLQIFDISVWHLIPTFSCPFFVTFHVKVRSLVTNFTNSMIDSNLTQQFWSASVNRKMTDVEILVGEESFGAHRSLLSARSPVFAAMFASGLKEAESGQVRIEDVDPVAFQHFLKFLYTGMFEPSAIDKELFTVADKYQVETLVALCRPASASQTVDTESIIKTFFSS